jgi:DNA invertase Pin-like site-specific DNA recombinase
MLIGYARTSTLEQEAGLDAQVRDLRGLGCKRIYSEQASSVSERPELEALLKSLRKGDKLIVTKLDRLARSVIHLGQIVERIQEAGADLQIVAMGVDTSTATGKLMLNVLGSVAQFEREMMLERQREGIQKAKAEGKYKGKKAKFSTDRALDLKRQGKSLRQIAENFGVSKQAVQQRLAGLE